MECGRNLNLLCCWDKGIKQNKRVKTEIRDKDYFKTQKEPLVEIKSKFILLISSEQNNKRKYTK